MPIDPTPWLPGVLRDVSAALRAGPAWATDEGAMRVVHGLLTQGLPRAERAASLSDALGDIPPLTWLRLREVAATRDVSSARTATALAGLAALDSPAVLMLGSDGAGQVGVAVGLPREERLARQWRAAQAPDGIWEPGPAPGWAVLADPSHMESAWVPRVVAADEGREGAVERPAGLDLVLNGAGSLGPWCAAIVLRPVPGDVLRATRACLADLETLVAARVVRTESVTDAVSSSISDPRAKLVADDVHAWVSLVEDMLRSGGWAASVHLCALATEDLRALGSAYGWLLGPDVASSQTVRRQEWDDFEAAATAPVQVGWLSSRDLGDLLVPPRESVGTVQVRHALGAGRQTIAADRPVALGTWLGTGIPAVLDLDDLAGHAFVTGITGSGKSTTARSVLAQVWNRYGIPFLVVDPAKSDYEALAGDLDGGLTVVNGTDLRMNALAAWPGRPPDQHIRAVSTAFRGSFGMPMPVPYVAAILLEELAGAARRGAAVSLHDALARLDSLDEELGYRGEIRDNIRASLGLRLRLLLQPSRAERIAGSGAPSWLADRPALVQLGDLADEEERSFIASLLVLYVADAARARGLGGGVRHVTVIEEAHRLMPEPRAVAPEAGDPGAVSARLMTHLLAEVRAYGEAVVVVDQSPAAVARAVLRSTNVKVVHRIVDAADQEALGGAMGLSAEEAPMLGALGVGRCLVSSRRLMRPQTAAVTPPPAGAPPGPSAMRAPAPGPPARCHTAGDVEFHHASERHGAEMEAAVALWAAEGARGDLIGRARVVRRRDPDARPACLIDVGVRRHVATLVRIGHLRRERAAAHESALWGSATGMGPAPAHPSAGEPGPHPACAVCPRPCIVRSAVASGGLPVFRAASAVVARSASRDAALAAIHEAGAWCSAELGATLSPEGSALVAFCVATHLSAEHGVAHGFATAIGTPVAVAGPRAGVEL